MLIPFLPHFSLDTFFKVSLFILYFQVLDSAISEAELHITKPADFITVRNKIQLFTFCLYF